MRVPAFVRRVTDPLLTEVRVPVLSGVNRGRRWSLVSAGSGYATGRRAHAQMELLARLLRPGDVMWDIGAHHGFVTLCAARRVGAAGRVHAFEPSARNRAMLERHVRWNDTGNVAVHPYALGAANGEHTFGGDGSSKTLFLGGGGERVMVRTAASLVADGTCASPTFAKIDVEGAEGETVAGLMPVLRDDARLMIAMHNREADTQCRALLEGRGFTLVASRALEACRDGSWSSDPDLFCIGPAATGRDEDLRALRDAGF
jgi:FkbM family methyltransferase